MDPPPEILEWFRVDHGRRTVWMLGGGATLVFVGATLVAAAFVTVRTSDVLHAVALVGAILLMIGLVLAFGGLTVLLAHDEYLALRADGIVVHRAKEELFFGWSDLEGVTFDEGADSVVLQRRGASPFTIQDRYSRTTPRELASKMEELRRKSALRPSGSLP